MTPSTSARIRLGCRALSRSAQNGEGLDFVLTIVPQDGRHERADTCQGHLHTDIGCSAAVLATDPDLQCASLSNVTMSGSPLFVHEVGSFDG